MNLTVYSSEDIQSWNEIIRSFPESHFMQTREWGQVKMQYGWQPIFKTWREGEKIFAAAMILMRTVRFSFLPFKWRILYIPKGPLLGDWTNHDHRKTVLQDLQHIAVENQAIFIKIDPDITMGYGFPAEEGYTETELGKNVMDQLSNNGWVFSKEQIQFRNTVIIDITQDEAKLLENMKQKTRYNLRLAGKKGVTTRLGREQDFDILYQMYAETAVRDKFIIREKGYYHTLWTTFYRANMARPIIASIDELDIAGLIIFHFSNKSWFLYGMSRSLHRDKMPNYLIQWEAIRYAKSQGCTEYDLWGAPDQLSPSDPLFNVYKFKQGLGGQVVRHLGAWDLPIKPIQYRLYSQILPKILAIWRWRSRRKGTQEYARQGWS